MNVSAEFGGKPTLYIFRAGTGSGTVTSGGNEINCSAQSPLCSATYGVGTTVALTATPAPGSTFAGWGTDLASCYGNAPTCTITTSFTQTVTAIFSKGTTLGGDAEPGTAAASSRARRVASAARRTARASSPRGAL